MSETLLIFIDSLPFAMIPRMPFLSSLTERWSVRPGFGYSVNIHAELFAGLLPDDVGYFGEWMINPQKAPGRKLKPLLPLLDAVFRPYVLNRGLQHLLTLRYHRGHKMPNIPLRHLDKFALEGQHVLSSSYPYPTLFTEFPNLHTVSLSHTLPKGQRDPALFAEALRAIPEVKALFVPLPDLDGLGHRYGIDGQPYLDHLTALDRWVQQLIDAFFARYPSAHALIISDHGMANATRGVYLDIEKRIGRATDRTYLYFSDASLLRVWIFDQALRPAIRHYLEQFGHGAIVSHREREEYGLTSPRFGDFIYVLKEGLAFEPSTFARHIPKGMHGYHPEVPSQQAVVLHIGPRLVRRPPRVMRDVYHLMRSILAES
jgi:hypothetical protein